jgi:pteridine reductase
MTGRRALVTGGAERIGRAIARSLAQSGCPTAIHFHRSEHSALELCRELESKGLRCRALRADLGDPVQCLELVDRAREALGESGMDILINNAAIFPPEGFASTPLESWERQMAVNLRAPFLLSRQLVAQLPAGVQGSIVNITDARVGRAVAGPFAYQLTKAALEEMTRMLAMALAPQVRVNAVAPGAILHPAGETQEAFLERVEKRVPLRRQGGPEAVAEAVMYLLREDFVTGEILRLDGGEYL